MKIIKDTDPDLYIDFDGNLHKVSDLKKHRKGLELEPEAPVIETLTTEEPSTVGNLGMAEDSTEDASDTENVILEPTPVTNAQEEVYQPGMIDVTGGNRFDGGELSMVEYSDHEALESGELGTN